MGAREKLGGYISTKRTVSALREERERILLLSARGEGFDPTGKNAAKLAEMDFKLGEEISRLEKELESVTCLISAVSDTRAREVLTLKYIRGLPVWKIAQKMYYSEKWVKKLHRRGFAEIEKEDA